MPKLPIVNYRTMHAVLAALGFQIARQKGSHVAYRHTDGRATTVPNHGNRDLGRPLIRKILQDINITPEQFREILENL